MPRLLLLVLLLGLARPGQATTIPVTGVLTMESVLPVAQALAAAPAGPITIELDSPGGLVLAGRALIAAIDRAKADHRIVTEVRRDCQSMCVSVFLAGDRRRAAPEARFMLHGISDALTGQPMLQESLAQLEFFRRRGLSAAWLARQTRRGYLFDRRPLYVSGATFQRLLPQSPETPSPSLIAELPK